MSAVQLSFNLRASSSVRTVHLVGSWDGYKGQLPLSRASSRSTSWTGTFRFQGSMLQQGQRYWYYYILDGYTAIHDPNQPSTIEPTTQRPLNLLDIPAPTTKPTLSRLETSSSRSRTVTRSIPTGRALSPGKIISPRPVKPNAARRLEARASAGAGLGLADPDEGMAALTRRFAGARVSSSSSFDSDSDSDSDASDVPSLSSSRSASSAGSYSPRSPASSVSCCTCERFGITRAGARVRLDCGGSRCGCDAGDSCADSEEEGYFATRLVTKAKRNGVVVRSAARR